MADPLRHRQTKGAATDMVDLTPPRHIPTLPHPSHLDRRQREAQLWLNRISSSMCLARQLDPNERPFSMLTHSFRNPAQERSFGSRPANGSVRPKAAPLPPRQPMSAGGAYTCSKSQTLGAATRLFITPHVFHGPAIVDAVAHDRQPLHIGLPAVSAGGVEDDRPHAVLRQLALDLPYQRLALVLICFHRLPVNQFVKLGIAVFDVVSFRSAYVVLVEILVGVVDAVAGEIERDSEILAVEAREPLGRVDRLKLAVDVDLLKLIDQDHRRVAKERQVARRHGIVNLSRGGILPPSVARRSVQRR